jgi:hypothetical protein
MFVRPLSSLPNINASLRSPNDGIFRFERCMSGRRKPPLRRVNPTAYHSHPTTIPINLNCPFVHQSKTMWKCSKLCNNVHVCSPHHAAAFESCRQRLRNMNLLKLGSRCCICCHDLCFFTFVIALWIDQPQVIAFCTRPLHAPTSPKNKNKNTMNEQQHRKQNLRKHRQRTEYDALYTLDLAP